MPAEQNAPVLPFTTGSPGMDSITRSVIIGVSGAATGIIVGWLNAHGFNDPNLSVLVGGAIFATLAGVAGGVWGWLQQKRAKAAIVQHVVTAAQTGVIPPAIAAEAEKLETAALNKAQIR